MLLGILKKFGVDKSRVVLQLREKEFKSGDGQRYLWKDFTLQKLKHAENKLKENYNVEIFYSEFIKNTSEIDIFLEKGLLWKFKQIYDSNLCIEKLANYIIKNGLSPLESIAYISAFAYKNFSYNYEVDSDNNSIIYETNNTIVSAVNNRAIRCVGYEQFFSAVVKELDDYFEKKGSKLLSNDKSLYNYIDDSGHSQSLVYIKDNKYKLDGNFFVDINDEIINFFGRTIADYKEYDGGGDLSLSIGKKQYIKSEYGEMCDEKLNIITSDKKYSIIKNNSILVSNISNMRKRRYGIVREPLTQDKFESNYNIFFWKRKFYDKGFRSCNLAMVSQGKIAKKVIKAYEQIKDLWVPTVDAILKEINKGFDCQAER